MYPILVRIFSQFSNQYSAFVPEKKQNKTKQIYIQAYSCLLISSPKYIHIIIIITIRQTYKFRKKYGSGCIESYKYKLNLMIFFLI